MIREREEDTVEEKYVALEWRLAAMVVDRICLIAFSVLIIGITVVIVIKAPYIHA